MICQSPLSSPIMKASNTHGRYFLSDEKFPVYFCNNCQTYQLSIVQDPQYYARYYNSFDYYNNQKTPFSFFSDIIDMLSFQLRIFFLSPPKKSNFPKRWLDVEAGDGKFLQKLSKRYFQPVGVEISEKGYKKISEKNILCFQGDFLSLDFGDNTFDIISFWHVLEHCNNPQKYLQKACNLLSENGLLVFALPWAKSLGFSFGKEHWFHLDAPRHVWWPTQKTIETLTHSLPLFYVKSFSPWWEYPLDLWWSVKKSPLLTKWLLRILYPLAKIADKETMIFIFKKTNPKSEVPHE